MSDAVTAHMLMLNHNHRISERKAQWRARCLERLGYAPNGDVVAWRIATAHERRAIDGGPRIVDHG